MPTDPQHQLWCQKFAKETFLPQSSPLGVKKKRLAIT